MLNPLIYRNTAGGDNAVLFDVLPSSKQTAKLEKYFRIWRLDGVI